MYRVASLLLLILALSFTAISAQTSNSEKQPLAKEPGVEEIKKAIGELGNPRFVVRDRAKKLLQQAGSVAEPYLEEAAKSSDEETANTAKSILENYTWGLYPDTPKEIRDLVEKYRVAMLEQRQHILAGFLKLKPVPQATIRKLLAKDDDPEIRQQMFVSLYYQIRTAVPALLKSREYDSAESLLELVVLGVPTLSAPDYAAFMYLRGKLDVAIKRFESQRTQKKDQAEEAAEVLVYLYRIKSDWAAARKAAEATKKDELVERILWQSSDWQALAAFPHKFESDRTDLLGLTVTNVAGQSAAYERLAGNTKAFEDKIEEIRKSVEDGMEEDAATLRKQVDALLMNSKAEETIKILKERKKQMGLTFELLCAQMKHKEAFALVDEARTRDTEKEEQQDIQLHRAQMLGLLGERDASQQLFKELFNAPRFRLRVDQAVPLIRSEARARVKDLAAEHAAELLDHFAKEGEFYGFNRLFEPIFGSDMTVARSWWNLFRKTAPNEKPAVAMKRVRDILAGKLDKKVFDELIAKMEKSPANQPELNRRGRVVSSGGRFANMDAVAAAYRAVGDEAKTEHALRMAAEKGPTRDRWLAYGDLMYSKKKFKEAAAAFAKAAKTNDVLDDGDDDQLIATRDFGPALATYLQGRATTLAGDAAEGQRLVELAGWLPLGDSQVRANLVEELNKRDWPEMARKEANMLLRTGWHDEYMYGSVLMFLARHAAKEKEFSKAADYYEKCLVGYMRLGASFVYHPGAYLIVPEAIQAYRIRGLFAAGKTKEGMKEAMDSLKRMPGNVELAIKLVPELEQMGKKDEADAIYRTVHEELERLLKEYPNSGYWRNSTAWVMANCRRDLDAALKHAVKAVELEPDNASYCDTLAEVHFRRGDRDKALELMKKCVQLDPKKFYFKKQLVRFKDHPITSDTPDEDDGDD